MTDAANRSGVKTTGSLLVASLFVVIGLVTLYDTFSYSDVDSKVFPRAAAILLVLASLASIVITLLKPVADEGFGNGSWWRRVVLLIAMLVACVLMKQIGFALASAIAFAGAMIAAMHDKWRVQTFLVYFVAGIVVVGGFYGLFRFGLNVPLP